MANTPQTNFQITNELTPTTSAGELVHFVAGKTTRGSMNTPDKVIKSWPEFVKNYGGYRNDTQFPLLCKRILDRGSSLRVSRLQHYTDITDVDSGTAAEAVLGTHKYKMAFSAASTIGNTFSVTISGVVKQYTVSEAHNSFLNNIRAILKSDFPAIRRADYETSPAGGSITLWFGDASILDIASFTGTSAPTTTVTDESASNSKFLDADDAPLFNFVAKYPGADHNNVSVEVLAASNGDTNSFDLRVVHVTDSYMNEYYANLKIVGNPTSANSDYLDVVLNNSLLVTPEYSNLSGLTGQIVPVKNVLTFENGDDGDTIEVTDYIGDPTSKTGLYSFDEYDDGYTISAPESSNVLLHMAGSSYVLNRKDLIYGGHISNDLLTATAIRNFRNSTNIDNKLVFFTAGGTKVLDPLSGAQVYVSELADTLGNMSYTFNNFKPWFSAFGMQRGLVPNAIGVKNNFGTPGAFSDLNLLSNAGINMLIRRDNKILMQNNITARKIEDAEQQLSVIMLELYLVKQLKPKLDNFLDEPNDIPTWKKMFYTVKPFLDSLLTERALFSYTWEGDQDANNLSQLQINNSVDVLAGKYKIKFSITPIPALREINVEIVLTSAGYEFNFQA